MDHYIYDPLQEYVGVFRDRFSQVAKDTFAQLAAEAHVDVEANRATCRQLHDSQHSLDNVLEKLSGWTGARSFLWVVIVVAFIAAAIIRNDRNGALAPILVLVGVAGLIFVFGKVNPRISELRDNSTALERDTKRLMAEAEEQMEPLNRLYDWDVFARMMARTVPNLEFDPYFTTQRLADLKATYNWDKKFNEGRSVVFSHSGLINGNPFVICRTRKKEWTTKVYTGSKTIYWTTRCRRSDGSYYTERHSQTLTASFEAPYPVFPEKTRLIYGNTAAPDLIFYRRQSQLAGKEGKLSFKWKVYKLRKKARDLSNADFAMMTNEEFEACFETSDRNDNQQFALLFTPLAQESMLRLLRDREVGYGDDFDFEKHQMINTIVAEHMQDLDLDMNPDLYRTYDYDKAEHDFYEINSRFFRAIYFCLAPLLCVPMYQQIRPLSEIYGHNMARHSSFWEHEALANFWGYDKFKHPDCVTRCILKTEVAEDAGDDSVITVYADGFRAVKRVAFVEKWGGDGRIHEVPVPWDEYLEVRGTGQLLIHEDNHFDDAEISQLERLSHISDVLASKNLDVYRRHIASKV